MDRTQFPDHMLYVALGRCQPLHFILCPLSPASFAHLVVVCTSACMGPCPFRSLHRPAVADHPLATLVYVSASFLHLARVSILFLPFPTKVMLAQDVF